MQCRALGTTGWADDHVYSLTDFPESYIENDFWSGIKAYEKGSLQEY